MIEKPTYSFREVVGIIISCDCVSDLYSVEFVLKNDKHLYPLVELEIFAELLKRQAHKILHE